MLTCRRMGGKESGRYRPATAVFLQEDVEATAFFLETLRPHLPGLQSQSSPLLLFPGVRRYASQQGDLVREVFGHDPFHLMGTASRAWHATRSRELLAAHSISQEDYDDLAALRRHTPQNARRHYSLITRVQRDRTASRAFVSNVLGDSVSGERGSLL